ncbi:alpha-ketoglutarate-dependent dioxygenase alkB homolog 7, mitochondrial [Topomyia yanbarensis]|uniref:alpha-ketoglutarate-dependent dioxygenase alkB homolog 7, mitochondrial n=1 Tax=Topomyia yanbarensis TaxID=2498891 RepID=UPI00273CA7CF|nr:alpha-ketoglutarate-dependent dioxygenase alkB homolog 7, mitochondrial [Topomyia yanbarensis]XP_058834856.1 alpha-ketoglutarate-dependent dioxygenase alkB homolog 7, mitochondrial [Topomyia yanbarensis]
MKQTQLLCRLAYKFKHLPAAHKLFTKRCYVNNAQNSSAVPDNQLQTIPSYLTLHGAWPAEDRTSFLTDMTVIANFITESEEQTLLEELEPCLKRIRYELDHWDDAIHGYRETERKHWFPANRVIFDRLKRLAFDGETLPYIHVLDLTKEGVIKPHVDSVRFCGSTIAGISLLTDSVMRMVRTNDEEQTNEDYRQIFATSRDSKYWADVLLSRRSLYIMKDTARYKFTHELLVGEESVFKGSKVDKDRRISIICRNEA